MERRERLAARRSRVGLWATPISVNVLGWFRHQLPDSECFIQPGLVLIICEVPSHFNPKLKCRTWNKSITTRWRKPRRRAELVICSRAARCVCGGQTSWEDEGYIMHEELRASASAALWGGGAEVRLYTTTSCSADEVTTSTLSLRDR